MSKESSRYFTYKKTKLPNRRNYERCHFYCNQQCELQPHEIHFIPIRFSKSQNLMICKAGEDEEQ